MPSYNFNYFNCWGWNKSMRGAVSFNQTILLNLFILIPRLQPGIFEKLAKKTLWQQHMLRLQWLKSRHIEYYFIFTSEPTPIQNCFSKGGIAYSVWSLLWRKNISMHNLVLSHDMHVTLSRNCKYISINPNVPCLNVILTNSMKNITFW